MRIALILIILLMSFYSKAQVWNNSSIIKGDDIVDVSDIVTNSGNSYIYGKYRGTLNFNGSSYSSNNLSKYDLFLACYNNNLEPQWIKTFGSNNNDLAANLLINSLGNIVVSGSFRDTIRFTQDDSLVSAGILDNFVAEFSVMGDFLFKKNIGAGNNSQQLSSFDQDSDGNYIFCGKFKDSVYVENDTLIGRSIFVNYLAKFDQSFNLDTMVRIDNNSGFTVFNAVKAVSDGYLFGGKFRDTLYLDLGDIYNETGVDDIFIYKTNLNLEGEFYRTAKGIGNDNVGSFVVDSYDNIYLAGNFQSANFLFDSTETLTSSVQLYNKGGLDIFIAKYNKTGRFLWAKNYGGISDDWARDIVINENALYICGYYSDTVLFNMDTLKSNSTNDRNIFIGTFDLNGNMLVAKPILGDDDNDDSGIGIDLIDNRPITVGFFQSNSIEIGDNIYNNTLAGLKSLFLAEFHTGLLTAFTKKQNPTCNSGADGELIVTPYFGVSPYTYTWSHDAGLNDSTATGLSAGTYFVTVTDALDSTDVVQYTLTEPDAFLFNPVITNVSTCSYSSEGAINLNVTGGNGTNTYYWVESNGGSGTVLTAEDQTGLTVGQYDVTVTDTEGCAADTSILIAGPAPVNFGSSTITAYTGADPVNTGAINLELGGGTGTPSLYAASWSGPGSYTAATQDISGLNPGNYTVTVTDGNACTFDTTITVLDDDKLLAYISYKKDDCSGGVADGKATVSYYTPNTTPNISFEWSNGETTQTVTGLGVGKYYVTVTDSNLGQTSEDSVEIVDLGYTISGSLTGNNVLDCKGDTDGNIDLTISSAGVAPYSYNWSNGKTTQDINNLTAGFYSVTITDANECVYTSSNYEISEPEFVLAATASVVSDPLCNGDYNGEIRVDANGGNGAPFTYQWNDPGSQTTQIADGLDAGNYTVTVTDWKGCKATSNVLLTQPQVLAANGLVGDISCYNGLTGTIALTVSGGTTPHSYFWQTNDGSGLVVTDKNQSGLSAAKYYVTVTDANLCEVEDSFLVSQPDQIVIDSEDQLNIENCFGDNTGEITIAASGGTGTLSYTLTPGDVENTTGIFTGLYANTYSVSVTDDNGCGPVTSSSIEITEPAQLQLSITNTNNISCNGVTDGDIDITVSGGTVSGAYTYLWTSTDGSGLVSDSEDQTGLGAGTYNVTASDDNGCEVTESATITEPDAITITIESVTDASSQTAADGSATVSATGGTGDIEFTLTPGDIVNKTGVFTNLTPGTYTINVTDEKSCGPVSEEFSVGYPDGIDYISEHNNVKIYPNPTSSNITVDIDLDNIENLKIEILGASGRVVESRYVFGDESIKEEIDLSKYSKGIYFVKITSNKVNLINKIILQ